jgi:hypothetical protein
MSANECDNGSASDGLDRLLQEHRNRDPPSSWPDDEDWDPDAPGLDDVDDSLGAEGSWRETEAVPEVLEAGFLPRDVAPSGLSPLADGPAAGFGSGHELDTMLSCVTLAGFADDVTGPGGRCCGASDDQLIGLLRAWDRLESWTAARKLSVITELIRRRPAPGCPPDVPDGLPGAWGKFCGDELAAATATSSQAADKTLTLAYDLATRLPGTARALHEGIISLYKARIIAEATRILDPADAAAAEALVLHGAAGRTPGQLRAALARAITAVNPGAAQARREKAQRDTRVELWREDAGTAALCGRDLPPADALAADQRITAYARELKAAGLDGTLDQLRARAFLDLTLGVRSHPARDSVDPGAGPKASGAACRRQQNSHNPDAGGDADQSAADGGGGGTGAAAAGGGGTGAGAAGDYCTGDGGAGGSTTGGGGAGQGRGDASKGSAGGPGADTGFAARINLTMVMRCSYARVYGD